MFRSFIRSGYPLVLGLELMACHHAAHHDDKSTIKLDKRFEHHLQTVRIVRSRLYQCSQYFEHADPEKAANRSASYNRLSLYGEYAADPSAHFVPYGLEGSCMRETQNEADIDTSFEDVIRLIRNDNPQPLTKPGPRITVSLLDDGIISDHLPRTEILKEECLSNSVRYKTLYNVTLITKFSRLFQPSCTVMPHAVR